jgi:hypothetical protein
MAATKLTRDCLPNPPEGISDELVAGRRIELLSRTLEPNSYVLKKMISLKVSINSATQERSCAGKDKPQVGLNKLLSFP